MQVGELKKKVYQVLRNFFNAADEINNYLFLQATSCLVNKNVKLLPKVARAFRASIIGKASYRGF